MGPGRSVDSPKQLAICNPPCTTWRARKDRVLAGAPRLPTERQALRLPPASGCSAERSCPLACTRIRFNSATRERRRNVRLVGCTTPFAAGGPSGGGSFTLTAAAFRSMATHGHSHVHGKRQLTSARLGGARRSAPGSPRGRLEAPERPTADAESRWDQNLRLCGKAG